MEITLISVLPFVAYAMSRQDVLAGHLIYNEP